MFPTLLLIDPKKLTSALDANVVTPLKNRQPHRHWGVQTPEGPSSH